MTPAFRSVYSRGAAKFLRHHQTRAEHRLWLQLRSKRAANRRFRRQVRLDRYIVDFVCFSFA